jgi:hypothetical protein
MPKASVNEDDDMMLRKNQVWSAREITSMNAIA